VFPGALDVATGAGGAAGAPAARPQ